MFLTVFHFAIVEINEKEFAIHAGISKWSNYVIVLLKIIIEFNHHSKIIKHMINISLLLFTQMSYSFLHFYQPIKAIKNQFPQIFNVKIIQESLKLAV